MSHIWPFIIKYSRGGIMNKDLPSVFANKIEKKLNNTQDIYYEKETREERNKDVRSVNKKIADIFNSINYVYKKKVEIKTKNQTLIKTIVGRKNNYLLTMENELININDIIDIKEI